MHGRPRATITHTVCCRLHSRQTLSSSCAGTTPNSSARSAPITCRPLTGQPHSSRSTFTLAAIGLTLSSVLTYCGEAYTPPTQACVSCRLRSAWMPPAVAHAPMLTR